VDLLTIGDLGLKLGVASLGGVMLFISLLWVRRRARAQQKTEKWVSAGGVVWNRKGEVAVVLQKSRAKHLQWTFPKGRIDRGETTESAALREVYEESGLRARILGYLGEHENDRHFTHYYQMYLEQDDGVHDRETKEVRFVKLAKARRLLSSRRDLNVLKRARKYAQGDVPKRSKI
jgi:8-oxo-dGTP pyrophosphatase MutT (NUDIX family)